MLEEEDILLCYLYVLVPSALMIVVTAEKAGPKVVSILVLVVMAGVGRLEGTQRSSCIRLFCLSSCPRETSRVFWQRSPPAATQEWQCLPLP